MSKIPTSKEILDKHKYLVRVETDNSLIEDPVPRAMIEFAKLHVQAALEAATANAEADFEPMNWLAEQHCNTPFIQGEDYEIGISRQSILQSYPLENIK